MRLRRCWVLVLGLLLLGVPVAAAASEGGATAEVTVRVLPAEPGQPPPKPPGELPTTDWGGLSPVPFALGGVLLIVVGTLLVRRAR